MSDYYKILGISEDATFEQIRRAYRIKAKKLHPDVYRGKDAKLSFQQLNEAYHLLINKDKRMYYDLKLRYDHAQYRKYGKNYEKRFTYSDFRKSNIKQKTKTLNEKVIDNFFFYTMLIIGIIAIIYGTIDLFFSKWEGPNNLTGFLFGLTYTTLLILGWYLRSKSDKRHIKTDFI